MLLEKVVAAMSDHQRKGPGESANYTRANTENSKSIVSEIAGTLMAALIFAASMWSSVFGMTGASDNQEAMIVAEVSDGR